MEVAKPLTTGEEYLAERQRAKEKFAKMDPAERQSLRERHFMHCPKCGMELRQVQLEGLTVDRCLCCSGTWFDAGEIEELAEHLQGTLLGRLITFLE